MDTRYLGKHRNQYRVRVRIPDAVRHVFGGKPYHKHGLGTGNLKTANLLKGEHVARFKLLNAEALASVKPGATIWEEAKALRARSRATDSDDASYEMVHRAEQLAAETNEETARAFAAAASGRATPLDDYLEAFLGDQSYRPKSAEDLRRVVGWLEAWLTSKHLPSTLEALSQPVASDFMRHLMVGRQLSRKSVQKYRSFLTAYWSWLEEQGHRPPSTSPWSGRLPEVKAPGRSVLLEPDGKKRPFTDAEMLKLLNGKPTMPHIEDLIRIAALNRIMLETGSGVPLPSPTHNGVDLRKVTLSDGRNAYDVYQELSANPPKGMGLKDQLAKLITSSNYERLIDGDTQLPGTKLGALMDITSKYRSMGLAHAIRQYPELRQMLSQGAIDHRAKLQAAQNGNQKSRTSVKDLLSSMGY